MQQWRCLIMSIWEGLAGKVCIMAISQLQYWSIRLLIIVWEKLADREDLLTIYIELRGVRLKKGYLGQVLCCKAAFWDILEFDFVSSHTLEFFTSFFFQLSCKRCKYNLYITLSPFAFLDSLRRPATFNIYSEILENTLLLFSNNKCLPGL